MDVKTLTCTYGQQKRHKGTCMCTFYICREEKTQDHFFPFWPGSKYTCAFLLKQYNNNIICHFFKYHTHLKLLISSMCTIYLWLCTPAGCTDSTLIVHASLVYVYQMRFDLSKKKKKISCHLKKLNAFRINYF